MNVHGLLREFQEDLAPWAADVLRIGKVFMHDPVKRVEQLFFEVHSVPHLNMESELDCRIAPSRIPRSMIGVDENLGRIQHRRMPLKISVRVRHIPISPPCIGRRGCGVRLPQSCSVMEELSREVRRRTFRWPGAARAMVKAYLKDAGSKGSGVGEDIRLKELISNLAAISGNPRSACWRLVHHWGVKSTRSYRQWTKPEQQRLLDLIASRSLGEVAFLLRRSRTSVRSMLHRLGANARMGEDWFTKHALAEALHVRADEVQKWIDRGWLKCRIVPNNGLRRELIEAEDFCEFCKQHHRDIVGNRLNVDRLNFLQTFVFPPSHAELLPVRSAKKEQEAYEEQRKDEQRKDEERDAEAGREEYEGQSGAMA